MFFLPCDYQEDAWIPMQATSTNSILNWGKALVLMPEADGNTMGEAEVPVTA